MRTYDCPKCGKRVGMEDINVSADILLCKACGETSRFSEVVDRERADELGPDDSAVLSRPPPKHLKMVVDPESIEGRTTFVFRRFDRMVFFLIPFTAVWGGLSMYGIYVRQFLDHTFRLGESLFGLPFLIGTLVLLATCLYGLFGRQVLTLARGKGRYWRGVGPVGWGRDFVFGRETRIDCAPALIGRRGGVRLELQLREPGSDDVVRICSGMGEASLDYIRAFMMRSVGAR